MDVPIYAVYEHDSLLRGPSEEGLLQHKRVAAWTQFQQEHQNKQIKNEPGTTKVQKQSKQPKGVEPPAPAQGSWGPEMEHTKEETRYVSRANKRIERNRREAKMKECCIPIQKKLPSPGPSSQLLSTLGNKTFRDKKVSKILELLIKYNYHNARETETAALIKKVVNIMESGRLDPGEDTDIELCKSKANILMQEEDISSPTAYDNNETIISDTITGSVSAVPPVQKRRSMKRKSDVPKIKVLTKPDVKTGLVDDTGYAIRKKRKAALAAENTLEIKMSEKSSQHSDNQQNIVTERCISDAGSILLYTLDSNSDNETIEKYIVANKVVEAGNETKKQSSITKPKTQNAEIVHKMKQYLDNAKKKKRKNSVCEEQIWDSINNLNSIEDVAPRKVHTKITRKTDAGNKTDYPEEKISAENYLNKTMNKNDTEKVKKNVKPTEKKTEAVLDLIDRPHSPNAVKGMKPKKIRQSETTNQEQDVEYLSAIPSTQIVTQRRRQDNKKPAMEVEVEEVVPLHRCILENENFAKVVAHKYLKDGPNMSEQTALLAAQYKITEAQKELDAGRSICSGYIYDRAVEILGIPMLKQLRALSGQKQTVLVKKRPTKVGRVDIVKSSPKASKIVNGHNEVTNVVRNFESPMPALSTNAPSPMKGSSGDLASNPVPTPHRVGKVVPVRMFKGPATIPVADDFQQDGGRALDLIDSDECIVSDEMHSFRKDSPVPAPKVSTPAGAKAITLSSPVVAAVRRKATGFNAPPELEMELPLPHYQPKTTPVTKTTPTTNVTSAREDTVVISDDEEPAVPVAITSARETQATPSKASVTKVQPSQTEEPKVTTCRINKADITLQAVSSSQKMVLPPLLKRNQVGTPAKPPSRPDNTAPQQSTPAAANSKPVVNQPLVASKSKAKPLILHMIRPSQVIAVNSEDIPKLPNMITKPPKESISPSPITATSRKQQANAAPANTKLQSIRHVDDSLIMQSVNNLTPQCTIKDVGFINAYEPKSGASKDKIDPVKKPAKSPCTTIKKNTATTIVVSSDNTTHARILKNSPNFQSKSKETNKDKMPSFDVVDLTDEPSTSSCTSVNSTSQRKQQTPNEINTDEATRNRRPHRIVIEF